MRVNECQRRTRNNVRCQEDVPRDDDDDDDNDDDDNDDDDVERRLAQCNSNDTAVGVSKDVERDEQTTTTTTTTKRKRRLPRNSGRRNESKSGSASPEPEHAVARARGDGNSDDESANVDEDPELAELAKLRCPSERTEIRAEREARKQKRCADYPGLAFGCSIFSSDTMMKFSLIKNELQNIMNNQLKRVSITIVRARARMSSFGRVTPLISDGQVQGHRGYLGSVS